jgi:hypothetical protein
VAREDAGNGARRLQCRAFYAHAAITLTRCAARLRY